MRRCSSKLVRGDRGSGERGIGGQERNTGRRSSFVEEGYMRSENFLSRPARCRVRSRDSNAKRSE